MQSQCDERVVRMLRELTTAKSDEIIMPSTSLRDDLGLDSFRLISLSLRLQQELEIDTLAHAERFSALETVDDLYRFVAELEADRRDAHPSALGLR